MMTVNFKHAFLNEWNRPLVDVAKENTRFLGMFHYYPSRIKTALNKELYLRKEVREIEEMFSEQSLLKVPILKTSQSLSANR